MCNVRDADIANIPTLLEKRKMKNYDQADRISEKIVDILNEEFTKPNCSILQILMGQMLAFSAVASTMRKSSTPQPFIDVMDAIQRCFDSMQAEMEANANNNLN